MKKIITPCIIFLSCFGWQIYAQNCSQSQVSNNFEGFIDIKSFFPVYAEDFQVNGSTTTFDLTRITANMVTTDQVAASPIASISVSFYDDNAGVPGTQIGITIQNIVPTSQSIIGSSTLSGLPVDVREVVIDLPTSVAFSGSTGTDADAVYWVQLGATSTTAGEDIEWEHTSLSIKGNPAARGVFGSWFSTNGVGTTKDFVMSIEGNCTSTVSCPEPQNLVVSNVSPTGADLSWSSVTGASGYNWYIFANGDNPAIDTPVDSGSTPSGTTTITSTGLSTISSYDFYVESDCGGTSLSLLAGTISFDTPPANDNLADAIPLTLDASCTGEAYTTRNATHQPGEPSPSCFVFIDNPIWFSFVAPPNGAVTVTTDILPADGDTYIAVYAAPSNLNDLSTLPTEEGCDNDGGSLGSGNMSVLYLYALTPGNTYYIQVVTPLNSVDFCIEVYEETCPYPVDLAVTNLTKNSADLSWTETGTATQWEIEYGLTGFTPGSGTIVSDNDGTLGENISGLTSDTTYDFYVTAICSSSSQSEQAGPKTFVTIADLTCSDIFTDLGGINNDYNTNANQTWIASPANPGGVVTVTFTAFDIDPTDALYIYDGPDASAPLISSGNPATSSGFPAGGYYGTSIPGPFNSTPPGGLTFVFMSDGSTTKAGWEATISCTPPSCPAPTILNAFNVLATSADLSWTENGTATEWKIEYGTAGFTPGTGTIVSDNDGTLGETITNLTPNTTYDFYVTAICGPGDESVQLGPVSFTTLQIPCPDVSNILASGLTEHSIIVTWVENGTATEWEVEYGSVGFAPGSGTIVIDNDGSSGVTISGLTPNTSYDVYVSSICGPGNESAQVGPATVTTLEIRDLALAEFSFYPNPTKESLFLKATYEIDQVVIYNILGEETMELQPKVLNPVLDLKKLQTGIYLMKVSIKGKQGVFIIIKE